jgi:cardiolipin synthase
MADTGGAARVLTLPNLLSSSRFLLAVGFLLAEGRALRLVLLAVAACTDFLDGWLARRQQLTSRLGALLDPVADRVFVVSVVIAFVADGALTTGQAAALLVRDIMSVIGWFVARIMPSLRAIPFRARWFGKVLTVVQLFLFLAVLVLPSVVPPLIVVAFVLGVLATLDYTFMLYRERDVRC